MPIYEYRCDACSTSFEKFQRSAGGDSTATCPSCGGASQRLLSMFANPRGASPEAGNPEHPGPPAEAAGGHGHGHSHGHSHGPGGHSHGPGGHSH